MSDFTVIAGAQTATTVKLTAYSFSANQVDVTITGAPANPYTITLSPQGTDGLGGANDSGDGGAAAMNIGSIEVTGLTGHTAYPWTAVQAGSTGESGQFRTVPGDGDDFSVFFTTCDELNKASSHSSGAYRFMKNYIDSGPALPVVAHVMIEDIGYIDGAVTDDQISSGRFNAYRPDAGVTGSYTEYAYLLGYARWLGLMNTANSLNAKGRDVNRRWVWSNLNAYMGIGDHEEVDDPELSVRIPARRTAALAAYDAMFGGLQTRHHDRAWTQRIGPLSLMCPDRITNCSTDTQPVFDYTTHTPSGVPWFGDAQIDSMKASYDTGASFTALVWTTGYRPLFSPDDLWGYAQGSPGYVPTPGQVYDLNKCGVQSPMWMYQNAEFKRLFSNTTDGLFKQADDNQIPMFMIHGDIHRTESRFNNNPAFADEVATKFQVCSVGSVNGNINQFLNPDAVPPGVAGFQGSRFHKAPKYWRELGNPGIFHYAYTRVDVYGSRTPKEIVVNCFASDDGTTDTANEELIYQYTFTADQYPIRGNLSQELIEDIALVGDLKYSEAYGSFMADPLTGGEVFGISVQESPPDWVDKGVSADMVKDFIQSGLTMTGGIDMQDQAIAFGNNSFMSGANGNVILNGTIDTTTAQAGIYEVIGTLNAGNNQAGMFVEASTASGINYLNKTLHGIRVKNAPDYDLLDLGWSPKTCIGLQAGIFPSGTRLDVSQFDLIGFETTNNIQSTYSGNIDRVIGLHTKACLNSGAPTVDKVIGVLIPDQTANITPVTAAYGIEIEGDGADNSIAFTSNPGFISEIYGSAGDLVVAPGVDLRLNVAEGTPTDQVTQTKWLRIKDSVGGVGYVPWHAA